MHNCDLVLIGLLYKAYPDGCQHRLTNPAEDVPLCVHADMPAYTEIDMLAQQQSHNLDNGPYSFQSCECASSCCWTHLLKPLKCWHNLARTLTSICSVVICAGLLEASLRTDSRRSRQPAASGASFTTNSFSSKTRPALHGRQPHSLHR